MQHIKNSILLMAGAMLLSSQALAGPELAVSINDNTKALDGAIFDHDGVISGNGSSNVVLDLNDSSTVLHWNNFNTESLETVQFNMTPTGQVLNVIAGPRTVFNGILGATPGASVYLVNTNGINFGEGSSVTILNGKFVASSLEIAAQDFMDGNYQFTAGENKGVIINSGTIEASHVGLIGNSIVNNGYINAIAFGSSSSASLIAGEAVTLTFDNAGLMQFEITQAVTENLQDPASNNNAIEHNVDDNSRISANHITLSAKTAAGIFDHAINSTGKLEAVDIINQNGTLRLLSEGALEGEGINVDESKIEYDTQPLIISIPGVLPPTTNDNTDQPTAPQPTTTTQPETIVAQQDDDNEPLADLNTLNANNSAPGNDNNVAASTSTSLGLYSVEDSGIRLPADQQDEF